MKTNSTKEIGDKGEKTARRYLSLRLYEILDTQYRSRFGEIDIIAKKKNILVFVEVRTRSENFKISPAESVTRAKQQRIIKTACTYIQRNKIDLQIRFDIIEVINRGKFKKAEINHIKNAFTYGDGYAPF